MPELTIIVWKADEYFRTQSAELRNKKEIQCFTWDAEAHRSPSVYAWVLNLLQNYNPDITIHTDISLPHVWIPAGKDSLEKRGYTVEPVLEIQNDGMDSQRGRETSKRFHLVYIYSQNR